MLYSGSGSAEDATDWHGVKTDDDLWQQVRNALGDWETPNYIGTPASGNVDWEILRTFTNVYRTSSSAVAVDVALVADLRHHRELRFRMYGLASGVTRRAPIIEKVIQRPETGWPVDNDDAGTFHPDGCFQWRYGAVANILNLGLVGDMQTALTSHVTQQVVDDNDVNITYSVTIQAGGRLKFFSPTNSAENVTKLIVFDQPGTFQRVRLEVSARP